MANEYNFDFESFLTQGYFEYLCEVIHVDQIERSYWILAHDLFKRPFYSLIPHDENRASDGLELREEYLRELHYPKYADIEGECSVLEMLIGLARRMDFETSDPYDLSDSTDRTSYWFWEMIDNLGLLAFDDESYVEYGGMTYVDREIDRLLKRAYSRNGRGGLFPLERNRCDQRNVELWYQMNNYLTERELA